MSISAPSAISTTARPVSYTHLNRKLPVTWFIKAMGAYKADNPNTWLSCIPDMTTGVVTNEQNKEVCDNDARIVNTLDKDTCNSRE